MKSIIYLSLLLINLQVHCKCLPGHHEKHESSPDHQPPPLEEEYEKKTIDSQNIASISVEVMIRLYNEIYSVAADENILFSPLSIALAVLGLGATSETQSQIYKALGFNKSSIGNKKMHEEFHHLIHILNHPSSTAGVNIGNVLFINESLKILPKFWEEIKSSFKVVFVDFHNTRTAEKQINGFVQNKTHGKIAHAVEGLELNTLMVLVNYVVFKGNWKQPFQADLTREEDFFTDENSTVKVPMMYREGSYNCLYDEDLGCWVVEVPYQGDATAFFILPDKGKMKNAEHFLSKETLIKWKKSFTLRNIELHIPKFSLSASYDIKDFLQRMGVSDVFIDNADLSGSNGGHSLKLSKAVHKIVLDVNESGTEAAAITTTEFMFHSAPFQPVTTVRFNAPFLYFLFDLSTMDVLFRMRVMNPIQQ